MRITPDSGHLDVFGEADTVLPAGRVVHVEGIPARLAADTKVKTHPGNARLMKARKVAEAKRRKKCAAMAEGTGPERHSAKAHRCVDKVQAKGHDESSAWAICTTSIGKRGVYAKGHGGNANPKGKVAEAREAARAAARRRQAAKVQENWSDSARQSSLTVRKAKARAPKTWKGPTRAAFKKIVQLAKHYVPGQLQTPTAAYPERAGARGAIKVKDQSYWLAQTTARNAYKNKKFATA